MSKEGAPKRARVAGKKPNRSAETAQDGTSNADFVMHEHIGRQLKLMFDEVVREPVPDQLRDLLEKLERKAKES